jgi:hypothetical protein
MKQKTLITIHHLSLSLFLLAGYHHYIDYKQNIKFKKEYDNIIGKTPKIISKEII